MRIVKQNFKVLPEIENKVNQIGNRSRICYLSEPPSDGDETGFVKGIIKRGHNSCLEMAAVTFLVKIDNDVNKEDLFHFLLTQYKYLTISHISVGLFDGLLITGTIRSFREIFKRKELRNNHIIHNCAIFLKTQYPTLFEDINLWEILYFNKIPVSLYDWKINKNNYSKNVRKLHQWVAVMFETNRAVTHEIVRHRPPSYLQESQRYCNYSKDKFGNELTFIEPSAFNLSDNALNIWKSHCRNSEYGYLHLTKELDLSPEAARLILSNSCRTRLIVYCNLKEWEHIFAMRASKYCDKSMQEIMYPLLDHFRQMFPGMFDDCQRSEGGY